MRREELKETKVNMEPVDEKSYKPGTVDRATKGAYEEEELAVFARAKAEAKAAAEEEAAAKARALERERLEVPDHIDIDLDNEIDREAYERVRANIAKRKAEREAKKHRPNPFKVIMFIIIAIIITLGVLATSIFNINQIDVEGNKYYSDDEVINMAHATIGKNLIYKSGAKEIKNYLNQNPYIEEVKISKKLPSTLVINVKEREQIAAIVYGDEYLVIDENGLLLRKTDTEPKLTLLTGIKVTKVELGEVVETEEPKLLTNALKLIGSAKDGDLYFTQIKMSELYIRAYIYESLVCIGTIDDFVDTIDKYRLQQVIDALFKKGIKRGTITLSKDGYASFSPSVA